LEYCAQVASAAILTIGNELVSGDVMDTNGSWLAHRLERLGVKVTVIAAVPDEIEQIARFIRREAPEVEYVLVTGGLGGTPDDLTREAIAAAFDVEQQSVPQLADALRARFTRDPEYAARWAELPAGSRALENPLGGAPGFQIENVYVFPGLPSEMQAMFDAIESDFRGEAPIATWRKRYRTRESDIVGVLAKAGERFPGVLVGSYPSFEGDPEVEVVAKSHDAKLLERAADWLETELAAVAG
jgi:molybdenum cofactor synthesis domain-containing protein